MACGNKGSPLPPCEALLGEAAEEGELDPDTADLVVRTLSLSHHHTPNHKCDPNPSPNPNCTEVQCALT